MEDATRETDPEIRLLRLRADLVVVSVSWRGHDVTGVSVLGGADSAPRETRPIDTADGLPDGIGLWRPCDGGDPAAWDAVHAARVSATTRDGSQVSRTVPIGAAGRRADSEGIALNLSYRAEPSGLLVYPELDLGDGGAGSGTDIYAAVLRIRHRGTTRIDRRLADLVPLLTGTVGKVVRVLDAAHADRWAQDNYLDMRRSDQLDCLMTPDAALSYVTEDGLLAILDALDAVAASGGQMLHRLDTVAPQRNVEAARLWQDAVPMLTAARIPGDVLASSGLVPESGIVVLQPLRLQPGDRLSLDDVPADVAVSLAIREGARLHPVPTDAELLVHAARLLPASDRDPADTIRPDTATGMDLPGDPLLQEAEMDEPVATVAWQFRAHALALPEGEDATRLDDAYDAPEWLAEALEVDPSALDGFDAPDFYARADLPDKVRQRVLGHVIGSALSALPGPDRPKIERIDGVVPRSESFEVLAQVGQAVSQNRARDHLLSQALGRSVRPMRLRDGARHGREAAVLMLCGVMSDTAGEFLDALDAGDMQKAVQLAQAQVPGPMPRLVE